MESKETSILGEVAAYYSDKLAEHGQTPQGVDWNGEESQILRFAQLSKIIQGNSSFTLNDLGSGYGALLEYLRGMDFPVQYVGIDISENMVEAAQERFQSDPHASFLVGAAPKEAADYSVASGIFNVRGQRNDEEWKVYLLETLETLDRYSKKGFAFNCLTSYSDQDKMRDYLYYANPLELFDLCKRKYAKDVALLHDYELYEFTILVRKKL